LTSIAKSADIMQPKPEDDYQEMLNNRMCNIQLQ
jgi:hypothetical protein